MIHIGICAHCGKTYQRNRPLRGSTCSQKCSSQLYRKKEETRKCPHCHNDFKVKPGSKVRYCSIQCFNRRGRRNADMVRQCLHCGKNYEREAGQIKRKFCSHQCRTAHRYGKTQYKLGIRKTWSLKPEIDLKNFFSRCQRCGWHKEPKILHRHHKDRDRANNSPKNIEILCPTCHVLEHFQAGDSLWKFA